MKYTSIVLSGLPGSGKSSLAEALSKELEWEIYSMGGAFRRKWKEKYPDGNVSFEDYWRGTTYEENGRVNVEAKKRFERGSVIADSRYSIYCKDLPSLLVFVTCPVNIRAQRSFGPEKYPSKSIDQIINILIHREIDENIVGHKLFHYDYRDPINYHLVLNSEVLSIRQEFDIIMSLFNEGKK